MSRRVAEANSIDEAPVKGRSPLAILVEEDAEREDVASVIQGPTRNLLWGHVRRRPHHDTVFGVSRGGQRAAGGITGPEFLERHAHPLVRALAGGSDIDRKLLMAETLAA